MGKRKVFIVLKGSACIVIGVTLILALFNFTIPIFQRKDEIVVLEKQKKALETEKKSLEHEIELLNDDDYVARYARENYIFTREGEQVAIIPGVE